MTSMGKSDTASEKLNYFIFKYIWIVRSRQTLKHHFFILSQAQPHSGLPYSVHALQGQQLLQERSACSSPRPPSAAGNTSFVMVECLWHATVSHSFCSLFLCAVFLPFHTQAFPELPLPWVWSSTLPIKAISEHLGTAPDPPRPEATQLNCLSFQRKNPQSRQETPKQNAVL